MAVLPQSNATAADFATGLALAAARPIWRGMRKLAIVVPLMALLAGAGWYAWQLWFAFDEGPMPTTGYVAMALGIVFSLVIGCGLMALMFYSSRHGYDEAAQGDTPAEHEKPQPR